MKPIVWVFPLVLALGAWAPALPAQMRLDVAVGVAVARPFMRAVVVAGPPWWYRPHRRRFVVPRWYRYARPYVVLPRADGRWHAWRHSRRRWEDEDGDRWRER